MTGNVVNNLSLTSSREAFKECLVALNRVKQTAKDELDKGMAEKEEKRLEEQQIHDVEMSVIMYVSCTGFVNPSQARNRDIEEEHRNFATAVVDDLVSLSCTYHFAQILSSTSCILSEEMQ